MKKVKVILALLSIALLLAIVGATNATPVRTPGVSVGNNFTYGNVSFGWHSDDPSATPPAEWTNVNNTEWVLSTVESVVGTNVTISLLLHYSNGTETTQGGWIDVDTGDGSNMTLFLISAGLNAGDAIYSGSTYSTYTINETVPMTYPGGSRDTNHINATMELSNPPYYISQSMNMYWDRATGVLTKLDITINQTMTYTTYYSVSIELTQSNQWVVPEFSAFASVLAFMIITAVVFVSHRRRLGRTEIR